MEPKERTLLLSLCGTMTIHLIDESEISIPAERGARSWGVGNQRANACPIENFGFDEIERFSAAHILQLYPTHGTLFGVLWDKPIYRN